MMIRICDRRFQSYGQGNSDQQGYGSAFFCLKAKMDRKYVGSVCAHYPGLGKGSYSLHYVEFARICLRKKSRPPVTSA